ncbi:hypothetical protein [Mycoplasma suis]|uniref:Uncharacterized protein n=1 Tax=Mycoplasma suis (strain Illinois) TaxID=768700 RepID=F0QRQ6_MYCSL|nr:hypothetical protein [Mycoplasma suis]ADX98176.1 hypothetical protein MSU_0645 [Mycoplasma suis str. Illinois]
MFTFSKIITLGALLAGSSGLSGYLITYGLGGKSKDFLFSSPISSEKTLENFSISEKENLDLLNSLKEKLFLALKNLFELRNLKQEKIEKLFSSISKEEGNLTNLYEKDLKIINLILKLSEELHRLNLESFWKQSELENVSYQKKLLKKLNEAIKSWEGSSTKIVEEINKGSQNTPQMSESSSSSSGSAGGGAIRKSRKKRIRKS